MWYEISFQVLYRNHFPFAVCPHFGCGSVFEKENADKMLEYMALNGYRHHVAITKGHHAKAVEIAFRDYLGYKIDLI